MRNDKKMMVNGLMNMWEVHDKLIENPDIDLDFSLETTESIINELFDDIIANNLTIGGIEGKRKCFDIKVEIPKEMYIILSVLTNGNPGVSIMSFKNILESIKNEKFKDSGIPAGYRIKAEDFKKSYKNIPLPDMDDDEAYEFYGIKWDEQKVERKGVWDSDNSCDYADYWKDLVAV